MTNCLHNSRKLWIFVRFDFARINTLQMKVLYYQDQHFPSLYFWSFFCLTCLLALPLCFPFRPIPFHPAFLTLNSVLPFRPTFPSYLTILPFHPTFPSCLSILPFRPAFPSCFPSCLSILPFRPAFPSCLSILPFRPTSKCPLCLPHPILYWSYFLNFCSSLALNLLQWNLVLPVLYWFLIYFI